jgi:hypothetical protein
MVPVGLLRIRARKSVVIQQVTVVHITDSERSQELDEHGMCECPN